MQVQEILQVALHHLEPDQQKDLAAVLPYLKSADKAGFKATLVSMVKSGGNERIKKCLQSLGAIGYNALEIQAWLQGSSVKAPHSAMVESADAIARRQAAETNPWTAVVHAPQVSPQARPVVQAQKPVVHVQQPLANAITAQSQPLVKPQAVTQKFVQPQHEAKPKKQILHILDAPAQPEHTQQLLQREVQEVATAAPTMSLASEAEVRSAGVKTEKKPQDKAALRKKLAERLSDGVQAKKAVQVLENKQASVEEKVLSNEHRLDALEEALKQETEERKKVTEENSKLRQELSEEEQKEKSEAAQIGALAKAESQDQDDQSRITALEEQNVKFRTALSGAARRLINLEATVMESKSAPEERSVKVVRHSKQPAQN